MTSSTSRRRRRRSGGKGRDDGGGVASVRLDAASEDAEGGDEYVIISTQLSRMRRMRSVW
eukprot:1345340-Pyramimonas_sp.AAC.1